MTIEDWENEGGCPPRPDELADRIDERIAQLRREHSWPDSAAELWYYRGYLEHLEACLKLLNGRLSEEWVIGYTDTCSDMAHWKAKGIKEAGRFLKGE